ncbi:MAG: FGGY family carbohydrate kinase [Acidimicrobiaceae bacterium]|nr:FGGY family carbohydrate kinase [Acidimicrobiaceae bacterium]
MSLTAAIDVGTTTVRSAVFDGNGERLSIARATLGSRHPFAGAVEQDPDELVSTSLTVFRRSLAEADLQAADIDALGITNQRSSVVAWDGDTGHALRPLIGWQDTRTKERVAEFVSAGIPLNTSASCTKLEWLMANDDSVAHAHSTGALRFGTVDTWLTWALSGGAVCVTDPSNAGATGLYDLYGGDWSNDVLALFGVPREAMATVAASDKTVGHCDPELVGAAVPLAARCGDQMAACAAHGMVDGTAKLTLGSSGMLDVGTGSTIADAPTGCYALPLWRRTVDGVLVDEFLVEGSILTAGSVIEWLVRAGLLDRVEHLDEVARSGSPGVEFVPSLAGLGSPHQDPEARGTIRGIGLETTAADVVLGALRGIATRVAELTAHMDVTGTLLVDGGLSQSQVLLEAVRETTALEIHPAPDHETTVRGIALLANRDN